MQEGYGFISFETEDAIMRALNACQNIIVHGITLKCTITHQHNPHSKKNKKATSPTAAAAAAMAAVSLRENSKLFGNGSPNNGSSPSHSMSMGMNWPAGPITSHNTQSLSALNPHLPLPNHLVINNFMPIQSTGTSPRISMQFSSNDSASIASSMESLPAEFDSRGLSLVNNNSNGSGGYNPFSKPMIEGPGNW